MLELLAAKEPQPEILEDHPYLEAEDIAARLGTAREVCCSTWLGFADLDFVVGIDS